MFFSFSDFIPVNKETNITTLTQTLQDILTAGIISDVEIIPWLLSCMTEKLKSVLCNLHPLVPQGFYLPAPPLYCPQPGEEEMVSENSGFCLFLCGMCYHFQLLHFDDCLSLIYTEINKVWFAYILKLHLLIS